MTWWHVLVLCIGVLLCMLGLFGDHAHAADGSPMPIALRIFAMLSGSSLFVMLGADLPK
jgi:hypothetical protein